jgi:3-methylcrotonyl-CoA carboxylase alpha subunit
VSELPRPNVRHLVRLSSELGDWTAMVDADRVTFEDADTPDGPWTVTDGPSGQLLVQQRTGESWLVGCAAAGDSIWIAIAGYALEFQVARDAGSARVVARDQDALMPPMPATVVRIQVSQGDRVGPGDTLIVLEAMKMELPIRAPRASTVRAIRCTEGQLVQPGTMLVELE